MNQYTFENPISKDTINITAPNYGIAIVELEKKGDKYYKTYYMKDVKWDIPVNYAFMPDVIPQPISVNF